MQVVGQPFLHELVDVRRGRRRACCRPADGQIRAGRRATGCSTATSATSPSSSSPSTGASRSPVAHRLLDGGRGRRSSARCTASATRSPTRRCGSSGRGRRRPAGSSTSSSSSTTAAAPIAVVVHRPRGGRPGDRERRQARRAPPRWSAATADRAPRGRWHGRSVDDRAAGPMARGDRRPRRRRPRSSCAGRRRSRPAAVGDAGRRRGRVVRRPSAEFVAGRRRRWAAPAWCVGHASGARRRCAQRSLDDLGALLLATGRPTATASPPPACPWFMTLFGRDSLWAARFALPVDVSSPPARCGRWPAGRPGAVDRRPAAEPGKILHEVRAVPSASTGAPTLPPVYYGTVDATPLWISLLHDAWCWGLPDDERRRASSSRSWRRTSTGWSAHDGFLAYHDESGAGWRTRAGRTPATRSRTPPGRSPRRRSRCARCRAYAYRAALDGARLLDAFGRPGADAARAFAADARGRLPGAFWIDGPHGPLPGRRPRRRRAGRSTR